MDTALVGMEQVVHCCSGTVLEVTLPAVAYRSGPTVQHHFPRRLPRESREESNLDLAEPELQLELAAFAASVVVATVASPVRLAWAFADKAFADFEPVAVEMVVDHRVDHPRHHRQCREFAMAVAVVVAFVVARAERAVPMAELMDSAVAARAVAQPVEPAVG